MQDEHRAMPKDSHIVLLLATIVGILLFGIIGTSINIPIIPNKTFSPSITGNTVDMPTPQTNTPTGGVIITEPTITITVSPSVTTTILPTPTSTALLIVTDHTPNQNTKPKTKYTCNCKKNCNQITSCAEAQYQLKSCKCKQLDTDKDGIACNKAPLYCQN